MILRRILSKIAEAYKLATYTPALSLDRVDYDQYWREKRGSCMGTISPFQKERADWIAPRIAIGSTVIDYGCGDGAVLLYLKKRQQFHAHGIDSSRVALSFLNTQGIATTEIPASAQADPQIIPECDHLLLLEILEHLENPELFLKGALNRVKGSIFISVPNSGYFAYRIRLLLGRSIVQWRLHPSEHLRYWTVTDMRWWLTQLGLSSRATIHTYEGIPILSKIWGSLFAMGIVIEIKSERNSPQVAQSLK
jgi:2-polyprenyl-3-methyl-5-hydroxy-6-metoxy-1,4-benzoquinol methylase